MRRMEYLVVECGFSYAVVLDKEGRFLKIPNLGYDVGEVVDRVILQDALARRRDNKRHFTQWTAIAACLCVMILGCWGFWRSPAGTVRIRINPDVQMCVNHFNRIVGLEGMNEDGKMLIEDYRFYGKTVEIVSDDLSDRAMDMGFLSEGGQIMLAVDSKHEKWKADIEKTLVSELKEHFDNRVNVVVIPSESSEEPSDISWTIVINPDDLIPAQTPGRSDIEGNENPGQRDHGTEDNWDDDDDAEDGDAGDDDDDAGDDDDDAGDGDDDAGDGDDDDAGDGDDDDAGDGDDDDDGGDADDAGDGDDDDAGDAGDAGDDNDDAGDGDDDDAGDGDDDDAGDDDDDAGDDLDDK